jgi:hypothetical protein
MSERGSHDHRSTPRSRRGRRLIAILACLGALACLPATASAADQGQVNLVRDSVTSFADRYIAHPTDADKAFMNAHYFQLRGYAPFHDQALSWAPPSTFYLDLYAIYRNYDTVDGKQLLASHPDWVLRDGNGQRLYIPFACSGGTGPQYAADITNPDYRKWFIDRVKQTMAEGYAGLYLDDVNMEMMVGNGQGDLVAPIDPHSGDPMTEAGWRRYVTQFVEQIDQAVPQPIAHNSGQWWISHDDPYYKREVDAASAIELERGFSQDGLDDSDGEFGFRTYLKNVDWIHSRGASVIVQPYNLDRALAEFELASYYLVSNGSDAICVDYRSDPDNWWGGWDTELGAAKGPRYAWNGLIRRDFANGFVLVNQPGAGTQTVSLGGTYERLDGGSVSSVALQEKRGAVLLGTPSTDGQDPAAPGGGTSTPPSGTVGGAGSSTGTATIAVRATPKGAIRHHLGPVMAQIKIFRHVNGHWRTVRSSRVRIGRRGSYHKRFRHLASGRYRATARRLNRKPVRVRVKAHRSFVVS